MALSWERFCPEQDIWQALESFGAVITALTTGVSWGEAIDAAKHPTRHRTAPEANTYPAPDFSRAKVATSLVLAYTPLSPPGLRKLCTPRPLAIRWGTRLLSCERKCVCHFWVEAYTWVWKISTYIRTSPRCCEGKGDLLWGWPSQDTEAA